jgi:hypothetical protein
MGALATRLGAVPFVAQANGSAQRWAVVVANGSNGKGAMRKRNRTTFAADTNRRCCRATRRRREPPVTPQAWDSGALSLIRALSSRPPIAAPPPSARCLYVVPPATPHGYSAGRASAEHGQPPSQLSREPSEPQSDRTDPDPLGSK